ncbi:MAG: hypothetical protein P8J89_01270 [Phycisphaerales bacterium]|nr:hypothetical protein [Phycisphaerales bacterium]
MITHLLFLLISASLDPATTGNGDVPWPVKLGAKALHRSNQIPMIDQVVLVPDADTWLDEMAYWSPAGQWPVLIEDDHFAPMFIRGFQPSKVYRRVAVEKPSMGIMERCQLILKRAWGAKPDETLQTAMARIGIKPMGLVLTSETSDAWPAALALAVGRGQELKSLDGSFGGAGTILSASKSALLTEQIRKRCEETGLAWDRLGDDLDAITICRNLPSRARMDLPIDARVQAAGKGGNDEPLAITDLLGRSADGQRYAMVGWINGDGIESTYIAMCSLFLKQDSAWLCNGYPNEGQWGRYGFEEATKTLDNAGFNCTVTNDASIRTLRSLSSGGISEDLILINSKGNRDFFDLGNSRGTTNDVPILDSPAALQMIHSWSLQDPSNNQTVGGRWLEHGVYAYIGSSHEPMLGAFVPPAELTRRLTMLVPFLVAGRWWDDQGPFSKTWRINTLGDPLMTIGPPELNKRVRLNPVDGEGASKRSVDLKVAAEQAMRQMTQSPDAQELTRALGALDLLGQDELARQLWTFGQQNDITSQASAAIMLGPLFRLQDTKEFIRTWPLAGSSNQIDRDMLWQLLGPRLADSSADDVLLLLESEVKGKLPSSYIEVLAPQLAKRFGTARVMSLIKTAEGRVRSGQERKRLEKLYRQFSTGR